MTVDNGVFGRCSRGAGAIAPVALAALAILIALAGCSRHAARADVGKAMLLPPMAAMLEVPEDQVFLMAAPISDPLPAFPPELVAGASEPVAVCAEIVVEAEGNVGAVTPLFGLAECPLPRAAIDPRYLDAVTAAVRDWQFFAAATCAFPPGVARSDDCGGEGVAITPVAIKLAYVFSFRVEDGRPAVARRARER